MLTSHSKTCSYTALSWFWQALTTRPQGNAAHVLGHPIKLSRPGCMRIEEAPTMLLVGPNMALSAVGLLSARSESSLSYDSTMISTFFKTIFSSEIPQY
jgi:hypothetical protein